MISTKYFHLLFPTQKPAEMSAFMITLKGPTHIQIRSNIYLSAHVADISWNDTLEIKTARSSR